RKARSGVVLDRKARGSVLRLASATEHRCRSQLTLMRSPMKVLAVIHAPVFSGPHNTMTVLGNVLKERGVEITVLLPEEGVIAAERIRQQGVEVITTPMHRARTTPDPRVQWAWLRNLRPEVKQIARIIRDGQFDLVVTHTLPNLHGALAARRAGVPVVWEIIDTFPPGWFRRLWMPLVLRLADAVLTTGRKVALAHPGTVELGDRWVSYYPAVDMSQFRAVPAIRTAARAELGIPKDSTVVGNVAAISEMKGHKWFIRAAAELRKSHPDTTFVILGSTFDDKDEYYRDLWSEAEGLGLRLGIDLIVRDPKRRVSELAQAFDIFWMTSEPQSEGIPTVIGEAKALGIPVIATDAGSTSEAITEGISGYMVPPRDPAAIVAATRRVFDNPAAVPPMRQAARREAEEQFAAERCAELHLQAFDVATAHFAKRRLSRNPWVR
ncbi:MAG: glycosyltransferase, partial [Nocardioides sp.]